MASWIKNCRRCGVKFSGRVSHQVYCSSTCYDVMLGKNKQEVKEEQNAIFGNQWVTRSWLKIDQKSHH